MKNEAKQTIFQIFGSASSTDLDAVFYVEQIPSIRKSAETCKAFAVELEHIIAANKKINVNIAVLENGVVVNVHKGTADELNNALYSTYALHRQWHRLQIKRLLPRDVPLKMQRCARKILDFLTRTQLRAEVKKALRADFKAKIDLLDKINLADFSDFERKGSPVEFRKAVAFQLGQALGLCQGMELYTKEAIASCFPNLGPSLLREEAKNADLQVFLEEFVQKAQRLLP